MKTLTFMLTTQYADDAMKDGDTGKALGLSEARLNELAELMEKDVKLRFDTVKNGMMEEQTIKFNTLEALLNHIDSGDLSSADLLFLLHMGYTAMDKIERAIMKYRFKGFDAGFKAATMGLEYDKSRYLYAIANAKQVDSEAGFDAIDINMFPKEIQELIAKHDGQ